jgi:DNA ligase-associated metallophosphoesterase
MSEGFVRGGPAARGGQRKPARQEIRLGACTFEADSSGALYWPDERTLIVADLHLEKGSAFARHGQMLPPYDTRTTLLRLLSVIHSYGPATVIALGDSFHDGEGAGRLQPEDRRLLSALQRGRSWVWTCGNHDPVPDRRLEGESAVELVVGDVVLRHEPDPAETRTEIAGHLHPAARLLWNGASVRRRCFASDARRLVMPTFGAFTGGLNLLSEPFAALFASLPSRVDMLGAGGIYSVPPGALIAD